jgi:hypothetical protein
VRSVCDGEGRAGEGIGERGGVLSSRLANVGLIPATYVSLSKLCDASSSAHISTVPIQSPIYVRPRASWTHVSLDCQFILAAAATWGST